MCTLCAFVSPDWPDFAGHTNSGMCGDGWPMSDDRWPSFVGRYTAGIGRLECGCDAPPADQCQQFCPAWVCPIGCTPCCVGV